MLHKKMDNLNLSTTEQELIKRDILHKESERYRQKYILSNANKSL